jgi:hypothetical protein
MMEDASDVREGDTLRQRAAEAEPLPSAPRSATSPSLLHRRPPAWLPFLFYFCGVVVLLHGGGDDAGWAPPRGAHLRDLVGGTATPPPPYARAAPDIVLVVPTTAQRAPLFAARMFRAASPLAPGRSAALLLLHGDGGGSGATAGGGWRAGVSAVRAAHCGDEPWWDAGSGAGVWGDPKWLPAAPLADPRLYHERSSLSCRVIEGLCAAAGSHGDAAPPPAFVAVVPEESHFRWDAWLSEGALPAGWGPPAARWRALPNMSARFVFTHVLDSFSAGLPEQFPKPIWPRMPLHNATLLLSGDVARSACTLHRAGPPLRLFGPPEMLLGLLLSTLEALEWRSAPQADARRAAEGQCPDGIFVGSMSPRAWDACASGTHDADAAAAAAAGRATVGGGRDMCDAAVRFENTDVEGSERSLAYPFGLRLASLEECCAACEGTPDCVGFVALSEAPEKDTDANCWPLERYSKTVPSKGRTFGGAWKSDAPPPPRVTV